MESKEKAKELYDKFLSHSESFHEKEHTKECALICVEEIEKALTEYGKGDSMELQNMDSEFRYWDKVKQEIKSF